MSWRPMSGWCEGSALPHDESMAVCPYCGMPVAELAEDENRDAVIPRHPRPAR